MQRDIAIVILTSVYVELGFGLIESQNVEHKLEPSFLMLFFGLHLSSDGCPDIPFQRDYRILWIRGQRIGSRTRIGSER